MKKSRTEQRDIDHWFELTYANYLVLPRALLQRMAGRWQRSFVKLLDEMREETARARVPVAERYRVQAVDDRGRLAKDPTPHYRRAPRGGR